jgi:tuftelin-interacting protein 11
VVQEGERQECPVLTKCEMLPMRAAEQVLDMRGPQPRMLMSLGWLSEEQDVEMDDVLMPKL